MKGSRKVAWDHVQQEALNTLVRNRYLIQVEGTKIGDEDHK